VSALAERRIKGERGMADIGRGLRGWETGRQRLAARWAFHESWFVPGDFEKGGFRRIRMLVFAYM